MKKLTTILLVLMCVISLVKQGSAQNLFIAPTAESTIIGLQYGGSVGFLSKKSFGIGAFYMRNRTQSEIWPSERIVFYGIQSSIPLVRSPKLVFSGNLRVGLANNQFVVVVPGAETRIKMGKVLQSVVGLGWRYGHAAINTSLVIKL